MYALQKNNEQRLSMLEAKNESQERMLKHIQSQVERIAEDVGVISAAVNQHIGASNVKNKIWVVIYSSLTVIATFGLHTFIFKYLGLHV